MSVGATPTRMCVACRRRFPKPQLLRHVLEASLEENSERGDLKNALVADKAQTKPGRGWYVCSDPACREKFEKMSRPGRVRLKRKGVHRHG